MPAVAVGDGEPLGERDRAVLGHRVRRIAGRGQQPGRRRGVEQVARPRARACAGTTARAAYTCAITLTSKAACQRSSGSSRPTPVVMPAFEQNRSIRPCSCDRASTRAVHGSRVGDVADSPTPSTRGHAWARRVAVDDDDAAAPSAAKRGPSAAPIPLRAAGHHDDLAAGSSTQASAPSRPVGPSRRRCRSGPSGVGSTASTGVCTPGVGVGLHLLAAPLRRAVQHQVVDHARPGSRPRHRPVAGRPRLVHRASTVAAARASRGTPRTPGRSGRCEISSRPRLRAYSASSVGQTKIRATDLGVRVPDRRRGTARRRTTASQLRIAPSASRPASRSICGRSAASMIGGGRRGGCSSLNRLIVNGVELAVHALARERGLAPTRSTSRVCAGTARRTAMPFQLPTITGLDAPRPEHEAAGRGGRHRRGRHRDQRRAAGVHGHDRGAQPQRRLPGRGQRERRERIRAADLRRPHVGVAESGQRPDDVGVLEQRHPGQRHRQTPTCHRVPNPARTKSASSAPICAGRLLPPGEYHSGSSLIDAEDRERDRVRGRDLGERSGRLPGADQPAHGVVVAPAGPPVRRGVLVAEPVQLPPEHQRALGAGRRRLDQVRISARSVSAGGSPRAMISSMRCELTGDEVAVHLVEQRVLAREVVVEAALRHAGAGDHLRDARRRRSPAGRTVRPPRPAPAPARCRTHASARNSSRAIERRCTSSGPSARRRVRSCAHTRRAACRRTRRRRRRPAPPSRRRTTPRAAPRP